MSDYKQAFEVESRKTGAQQIVIGEQREDIERLTASNEANADHARLANHNQDLLRAANKRLQARVEELEADAETHDAQLTKVARLRLDLESENIRLQARVEKLGGANARQFKLIEAIRSNVKAALAATEQESDE